MPDPALPPSLAAELAELRRRLDALERSPRLPWSSSQGGSLRVIDPTQALRLLAGNVTFDGSIGGVTDAYGVFAYGDDQTLAAGVRQGDRGLAYPTRSVPMSDPAAAITVTSAGFVDTWAGAVNAPGSEVATVVVGVATDAGTTGEVQLYDIYSASGTNAAVVGSSANGYARFEWLHPATTGLYDSRAGRAQTLRLAVRARRTSGTGNLYLYPPATAELTSRYLVPTAATTGNPSFA